MKNIKETRWEFLIGVLNQRFQEDLDMKGILFLIGLQELGHGYARYKKDQKVDIMHIAICTLLEPYGYYTFEGRDGDNWPHWKLNEQLPPLKPGQQVELMKEAIVEYFEKSGVI